MPLPLLGVASKPWSDRVCLATHRGGPFVTFAADVHHLSHLIEPAGKRGGQRRLEPVCRSLYPSDAGVVPSSGNGRCRCRHLVQSVFVVCYEKIPSFQYDAQRSFCAWLKTVLMNAWRNHCRRRSVGPTLAPGAVDPDSIPATDPRLELDEAEYCAALIQRAMLLMRDHFESLLESLLRICGARSPWWRKWRLNWACR